MFVCTVFTLLLLVLPVVSLHSEYHGALSLPAVWDRRLLPRLQSVPPKQECPTWFTGNRSSGCECHEVSGVVCRSNYALVFISTCLTFDANREQLQAGLCPFGIALDKTHYVSYLFIRLPDDSSNIDKYFCDGLKRTGVLCSKCQTGFGPPVLSYSFKCVQCLPSPYGWLLYIFLVCFPTVVFSLLVFLLQIRINSPQLNIIVFVCQYLALLQSKNPDPTTEIVKAITTLYSLWNLEFFRYAIPPFCVSEKLSLVDVYVLEYLVAACPLFLVMLSYLSVELHARGCKILVCLWKPFKICCTRTRRRMDPRGSIVNAFATLLMLSYTKLVITSVYVLRYFHFNSNNGEEVGPKLAYLDASMQYYSTEYFPYLLLSSFVVAFLVVLPALFLCLYPLRVFQRCLHTCDLSRHALHAFADSFNGHYKNITDNTYDCRFFGSFYLALRIVVLLAFLLREPYNWLVQIIMGVVTMFLLVSVRPYKDDIFTIVDSLFIGVWTISLVIGVYIDDLNTNIPLGFFYVVGLTPLTYLVILAIIKLLVHTKLYRNHFNHFHKARDLIERFIGYRSGESQSATTNTCTKDSDLAHRLVHPEQYKPASYGATSS